MCKQPQAQREVMVTHSSEPPGGGVEEVLLATNIVVSRFGLARATFNFIRVGRARSLQHGSST